MVIQFVNFSNRGTIFLPKNHHTQRKLLNFENWVNRKGSKSAKIRLSKSIFYIKTHPNLSQFFSLKNTNIGAQSKIGHNFRFG